jgi:hypothetical protein
MGSAIEVKALIEKLAKEVKHGGLSIQVGCRLLRPPLLGPAFDSDHGSKSITRVPSASSATSPILDQHNREDILIGRASTSRACHTVDCDIAKVRS